MTIGQRIAQKRKELGLSQEGLGERLGVSRQSIHISRVFKIPLYGVHAVSSYQRKSIP